MSEQLEIPTFGDMQAEGWSPEATETAPTETTTATTAPEPEPIAAAPAQNDGFERYLAMQQAQTWQAQQQQQNAYAWQQWNQTLTPPALPSSKEEREKLILDPDRLVAELEKRDRWSQQAFHAMQGAVMQTREEMARAYQMGQAQTAAVASKAVEASNTALTQLQEEGFSQEQIRLAMDQADMALQQNPQNYLQARTDPNLFAGAIAYTLRSRGIRPTPGQAVASRAGIGYSPSAPPQTHDPRSTAVSADSLARAERAFGVKFTPQDLQNAGLARVS